mmetsp:Transcript_8964/g.18791  ORF Transcript_8964/g.18791 Transcript_8964/m.18791 type:complete len:410 (-) Transcript_8964:132-1361(-)|eukprot:CAMPEP_0201191624 /NCGR_PEP_ID=MMETSP0851-20130426/142784_1 /ASSEMBLY_ACC=CAM_ASM_000631 /TAXON_ID=183588 /ORGANISM="Pseudo-nitzschia fraudulenta, Strain WWA7" /LENGTH=409 /DNA_ID=CAMNT_0047477789 /DNA_START=206 /DNA_END=1435 /DNA_ORIENTATION=-
MIRTKLLQAPIITILSPCFTASKKAVSLLSILGSMEQVSFVTDDDSSFSSDKALNNTLKSSIPGFSRSWHSVGARCPVSGSIVHFCSTGNCGAPKEDKEQNSQTTPFSLLAITDTGKSSMNEEYDGDVDVTTAIGQFRNLLASQINEGTALNKTLLSLKGLINGNLTTNDLLKDISPDGLPLLSIPDRSNNGNDEDGSPPTESKGEQDSSSFLKEIVVPHFDYAVYKDGSTLMSKLALATTNRPAIGVYEWPNSTTCIRPLPTAAEDKRLPSPSLIFHCESPEDAIRIREHGFREARIGYGGLGPGHGQVMLLHKDLVGLDIRYCPRSAVSSAFSEAQESLLAGSLEELQSTNILVSGTESAKIDERIGNGDCWVEVRANLKRPSNYWQRSKSSSRPQKIAKIPDLPPE